MKQFILIAVICSALVSCGCGGSKSGKRAITQRYTKAEWLEYSKYGIDPDGNPLNAPDTFMNVGIRQITGFKPEEEEQLAYNTNKRYFQVLMPDGYAMKFQDWNDWQPALGDTLIIQMWTSYKKIGKNQLEADTEYSVYGFYQGKTIPKEVHDPENKFDVSYNIGVVRLINMQ